MFEPITIPFGAVMLFNVVKLKADVSVEDVELALGEMCNVVKNTYGDDKGGFIAGIERVIERERKKRGLTENTPVLLQLREGNRLSITDPATEWTAELMGFGATNSRTFARLLDQPKP